MTRLELLVLLSCVSFSDSQRINSIGGPFRVIYRNVEMCPVELRGVEKMTYYIHISRAPASLHNYRVTGNMTFHESYSNNSTVKAAFSSWSNTAGWRENAHIITYPRLCDATLLFVKVQYTELMLRTFGEFTPCPLPKAIYRFDNVTINVQIDGLKHFIYGRWRVDVMPRTQKGIPLGCMRLFFDTVPLIRRVPNKKP